MKGSGRGRRRHLSVGQRTGKQTTRCAAVGYVIENIPLFGVPLLVRNACGLKRKIKLSRLLRVVSVSHSCLAMDQSLWFAETVRRMMSNMRFALAQQHDVSPVQCPTADRCFGPNMIAQNMTPCPTNEFPIQPSASYDNDIDCTRVPNAFLKTTLSQ